MVSRKLAVDLTHVGIFPVVSVELPGWKGANIMRNEGYCRWGGHSGKNHFQGLAVINRSQRCLRAEGNSTPFTPGRTAARPGKREQLLRTKSTQKPTGNPSFHSFVRSLVHSFIHTFVYSVIYKDPLMPGTLLVAEIQK